jgi:hypothetical protein
MLLSALLLLIWLLRPEISLRAAVKALLNAAISALVFTRSALMTASRLMQEPLRKLRRWRDRQ